ncbi:MAG: hypothetical protein AABX39_06040 [Nanoarchaeota archaeon]
MSEKKLVQEWYTLKVDESKLRNAKGIFKCINEFVTEQCGLEVLVNGGTLLIHDSSPGSYPYGNPDGETVHIPIAIYHLNDCTLKLWGYSTRNNYGDRFQISIFGEQKNVQKLTLALDELLTYSELEKYEKK